MESQEDIYQQKAAFDALIQQHRSLMLAIAANITGPDEAEDVVQEAFLLAWRQREQLREPGHLRAWVIRIVINQAHTRVLRSARRMKTLQQAGWQQWLSSLPDLEQNWDLEAAINGLPAPQQEAIYLHYFSDMSLPLMSQFLQISENTLKYRVQAALTSLRRRLHLFREEQS